MGPREEEARLRLVAQWLAKAEMDLAAARTLLAGDPPLFYPACFHCQQAAEKFIKAFLTYHQVEFPKTHAIGQLLDLMAVADASLAESLASATVLSPYGVGIRYPGDESEPGRPEARTALDLAEEVRRAVLGALSPRS